MQEWKQIKGYKRYFISNDAKVKSIDYTIQRKDGKIVSLQGKLLKQHLWKGGYLFVVISENSIIKQFSIHRLMAEAFIDNPENKPQVNHINGNKQDNRIENLEWCTMAENNLHAYRTGLKKHHACWKGKNGYNHNKSKEVIQMDLEGNILNRYGSARVAAVANGLNKTSLSRIILKEKGYKNGKIYRYSNSNSSV